MDHASLTNFNTNTNAGVGSPMTGGVGGMNNGMRRQDTRDSYLSYASTTNTPSWVNPSTMLETQAQSTPVNRGGSRPLPNPANYSHQHQHHGYNTNGQGYGYAGGGGSGAYANHGYHHHTGGHAARPSSGGYVITNVTEEEEEYDEDGAEEEEQRQEEEERTNFPSQFQSSYGYSMPVGMGGPNGKGVPMERVAPPSESQLNSTTRRPLPIPGASQPLGGTSAFDHSPKKKSFVGGFFLGLRRLPKRVLRYGSKKDKRRFRGFEEPNLDGGLPMGGYGGEGSEHGSLQGPTAGQSNVNRMVQDEEASGMPGSMPLSPPVQHQPWLTPTTAANEAKNTSGRRRRGPSFSLTPPPGETLGLEHMNSPGDQEYFNAPPESGDGEGGEVSNGAVDYPLPSAERDRATVMRYQEESPRAPATQETHGTMATGGGRTGTPTSSSSRPATVRQNTSASMSRMASNHTSGNMTSSERVPRAGTPAPAPAIDTAVSPPQNGQSPETAHPPPANDYMKMSMSPRTQQTHGTEVTEYTTFRTSRSFTNDPSFSSELNPVFRFFHSFYHLPWISQRSTVDYSPLAGFGGKSGGRGIMKKPGQSWYRKKGDTNVGGITSNSLDLLAAASGEGDTGSVLSPLGGWRRRVTRRNTADHGRHRHHHGHRRHQSSRHGHGHGRGHGHEHNNNNGHRQGSGRRRYRRRSTSTITFEEYHHQRNPSPMIPSTYPFPFVSPPFPYFQAFPAMGGGSPANVDTSITANQGTPAPGNGTSAPAGGAAAAEKAGGETQPQGHTEPRSAATVGGGGGNGTPRGPRGPWGGRAAIYPGGFAAYPPSPPMYPAPVWYPAAPGGGAEGDMGGGGPGRRQAGVVYMPVMPGGYV